MDPETETRLVRKLDTHIVPVLFIIYLLCYLDRSNIGNAKIQGMTEDLDLDVDSRYNIVLFVFFIPYILFELPSNIILHYVHPSVYLASLTFCWGVVNMCMGFVQSFTSLVVLRFLLGLFEAGLYPGIIYLMSMYYRRYELQRRMAGIWNATLLGNAFSGLLAYAISHLGGARGFGAWRWIFIIEGAVTAAGSLIAVFLIADWPDQARFLTKADKELVRRRLKLDSGDEPPGMEVLNGRTVGLILRDWKIWLTCAINFGVTVTQYSMSYFLPTILNQMGWEATEAQIHTIPVYLVSWVVLLATTWLSDRLHHRFAFIVSPCIVATVGYILLLQRNSTTATKYAATFLVEIGTIATPFCLTWLMNNLNGHWKRGFGSAIANMISHIAGLVGSNVYLARQKPHYTTGYSVGLASLWITVISAIAMAFVLVKENKKQRAVMGELGSSRESYISTRRTI